MADNESKFAQFIASKKLDARRIVAASHKLERLLPEDRAIRLNKRRAKAGEGERTRPRRRARPAAAALSPIARSQAALSGGPLSGPTKTRILHAVNHLLEQKKQEKVELRVLF